MYHRDSPPVTGADDDAYSGPGYDRVSHVQHLKTALFHAKEVTKYLRRAIDLLDGTDEMPEPGDVGPTRFDDDVDDNQQGARRAALFVLRSLS